MTGNKHLSDMENAAAVAAFLQTNGATQEDFEPDAGFLALLDKNKRDNQISELEYESYLSKARQEKQNLWIATNVAGLKGCLRFLVHTNEMVEANLQKT